jgi:TIR domain
MSGRAKVFISYAREDYAAARRLFRELLYLGVEPWLDKECILPGQRWELAIETAIRESNYVVAVLSANSVEKRGYIQKELRIALDALDRVPESQVFLIPVKLDETTVSNFRLRELQWVEMYPSWDEGFAKIRRVLDFASQANAGTLPSPSSATETTAQSDTEPALDLTGTVWSGDDLDGYITYEFLPRSILKYTSISGTFSNGEWTQDGASVYWQMNDKYAQYRGEISGDRMEGTGQNVAGKNWRWNVRKSNKYQANAGTLPSPSSATETTAQSDTEPTLDLTNTVWSGDDVDGRMTYEFLPRSILKYTSISGTFSNGKWTQDGASVYWQMNDKYAQYRGEISGDRMEGTGQNVAGEHWRWNVRKSNNR